VIDPEENLDRFRTVVRAELEATCPASMRTRAAPAEQIWGGSKQLFPSVDARQWLSTASEKGWTAPTWPTRFGGAGWSRAQAAVLTEEMKSIGARQPLLRLTPGLSMLGPVLLEHGTPEQCDRFLPPIARGDVRWCQGYSEPSAGSDLASVRTRAVLDDDHFVVTGQKIWSSYAHLADWAFCLVRTDPEAGKHEGLSFLLLDLSSVGVSISPITLISGKSDFCEVFFDDVMVPVDNLVGGPGHGWNIAKRLLDHERSSLGSGGAAMSGGSARVSPAELAKDRIGVSETGHLVDLVLRDRIASHMMRTRALRACLRRYEQEGRRDPAVASLAKLVATEASMERQDLIVDILGIDGLSWQGEHLSDAELQTAREWLRSRGNSIEGGTSEIQLDIIAKRGLGLPASRAVR
jgi:alkylation response protein AidB-like acyl-CoA dehydrogenase